MKIVLICLAFLSKAVAQPDPRVSVVNMTPVINSGEQDHDIEPSLAVNPQNPSQIIATAMTQNRDYVDSGPVYISNDEGNSWSVAKILPMVTGSNYTYQDATVSFSRKGGGLLYASMLKSLGAARKQFSVYSSSFPPPAMVEFSGWTHRGVDQPYIQASTVTTGGEAELVLVGMDDRQIDQNGNNHSAAVDQYTSENNFSRTLIDSTGTNAAPGGAVRIAVHAADEIAYAVFFARRTSLASGDFQADVMVVSDTNKGSGVRSFTSLNGTGQQISTAVLPATPSPLGTDRAGPDLSVAVSPVNSNSLYVAWGDKPDTDSAYTLHFRMSQDAGATWSQSDAKSYANAKNPALAVNNLGNVALVYQQLNNGWWETRVEEFDSSLAQLGNGWTLARWQDGSLMDTTIPMQGDYVQILTVGGTFYGIFSASNHFDQNNFPNGISMPRNKSGSQLLDVAGTPVSDSLDPFFFRIAPATAVP